VNLQSLGQQVSSLVEELQQTGYHEVKLDNPARLVDEQGRFQEDQK